MFTSSQPSAHLYLDGVSVSFAERRVLTDVSFTVAGGDIAGLIGENGSGKTTLLHVIAGLIIPDGGTVRATTGGQRHPTIGVLRQQLPFAETDTVEDAIEHAIAPVRAASAAITTAATQLENSPNDEAVSAAYARSLDEAERLGVWDIDGRVASMLSGLGLADIAHDRPTGRLSGGQRARLALAVLLLSGPDILLLDEPTNHLDDDAVAHLTSVLSAWAGPVLIASHDRAFLDDVVTLLLDLDPSPIPHSVSGPLLSDGPGSGIGVTRFTGTYTDYLHARLDARQRWEEQYRDEQAEIRRLRARVKEDQSHGHDNRSYQNEIRSAVKFYTDRNAKVIARRVNDVRSRMTDLEEQQVRKPPQDLVFRGLTVAGGHAGKRRAWSGPILTATDVSVAGRLAATSLSISAGDKLLITGPNGVGKSTLLQLLAGKLDPTTGSINAPAALRIGVLAQEADGVDPSGRGPQRTTAQVYEDLVSPELAESVPLATFGLISGRDENRPAGILSGGQQRRLVLAALLADPPDVLILDEPTNHFSLLLVTQLEAAIPTYPGTVVVASHDRWLRRAWAGDHLHLAQPAVPVEEQGS